MVPSPVPLLFEMLDRRACWHACGLYLFKKLDHLTSILVILQYGAKLMYCIRGVPLRGNTMRIAPSDSYHLSQTSRNFIMYALHIHPWIVDRECNTAYSQLLVRLRCRLLANSP